MYFVFYNDLFYCINDYVRLGHGANLSTLALKCEHDYDCRMLKYINMGVGDLKQRQTEQYIYTKQDEGQTGIVSLHLFLASDSSQFI